MSEKYVNYYIDTLVGTLTDCVVRNVSLQANAKVTEDVLQEQQSKITALENEIAVLSSSLLEARDQRTASDNSTITDLRQQVNKLSAELESVSNIRNEYAAVKGQLNHLDNFRNEVIKARNEIKTLTESYESKIQKLNEKLEYYQLSPAKRKKLEDANKPVEVIVNKVEVITQPTESTEDTVKDGGSF